MMNIVLKGLQPYFDGGAIYLCREKECRTSFKLFGKYRWILQNIIIWKKKAIRGACPNKFGKQYQIIVYATKEKK
jgi:hypothetical protein